MPRRMKIFSFIACACLIPDSVWAHGGYETMFLAPFILALISLVFFQALMVGLGLHKRFFRSDWAVVLTMLLSGVIFILVILILGALDIKNLDLIVKIVTGVLLLVTLANFILPLWQRNRANLEEPDSSEGRG